MMKNRQLWLPVFLLAPVLDEAVEEDGRVDAETHGYSRK